MKDEEGKNQQEIFKAFLTDFTHTNKVAEHQDALKEAQEEVAKTIDNFFRNREADHKRRAALDESRAKKAKKPGISAATSRTKRTHKTESIEVADELIATEPESTDETGDL